MFQMLLMQLVPGTSIVTPLIGKYLLFTCIVVSMSVILSVIVLNLTQRSSSTHTMPSLVRRIFIDSLPRLLCMQRPVEAQRAEVDFSQARSELLPFDNPYKKPKTHPKYDSTTAASSAVNAETGTRGVYGSLEADGPCEACARRRLHRYPPSVRKALDGVVFIGNHLVSADDSRRVSDDWKFLAKVVDRILLYVYITVCFVGVTAVMMSPPSFYDSSQPIQTDSSLPHAAPDAVFNAGECSRCQ